MLQPIPRPQVLDPDRLLSDEREDMSAEEHRARAQRLDDALHESCAYAQQLWSDLDAVRHYLMASLPPDPHTTDPDVEQPLRAGASPTGPHDDQGWAHWIDAFAAVTSALAGPRGDSGYGLGEARHAAQQRRMIPPPHRPTPDEQPADGPGEPRRPEVADRPGEANENRVGAARRLATAAVVLLAARGLGRRARRPARKRPAATGGDRTP